MAGPYAQPDSEIPAAMFINKAARQTDPSDDEGRTPILEADGKISPVFQTMPFGGDGADGELDTTSAPVTINLSSENVVQKNYTKITINVNDLSFSNPASAGTIVFLRSQGDVTIASGAKIDAKGIGAAAKTIGFSLFDEEIPAGISAPGGGTDTSGAAAPAAMTAAHKKFLIYDPTTDEWKLLRRVLRLACGSGGGNGAPGKSSGGSARGGGSGSSASYYTGAGVAGVAGTLTNLNGLPGNNGSTPGVGGSGGSGASSDGGSGGTNGSAGIGGRGGGCLVIECAGELIFTGEVDVSGEDGTAGGDVSGGATATGGGGGGAGGSAGTFLMLANKITTNTGTITNKGGNGGKGGDATSTLGSWTGGPGGTAHPTNYSGFVIKNRYF